jgi:hypothetical protein
MALIWAETDKPLLNNTVAWDRLLSTYWLHTAGWIKLRLIIHAIKHTPRNPLRMKLTAIFKGWSGKHVESYSTSLYPFSYSNSNFTQLTHAHKITLLLLFDWRHSCVTSCKYEYPCFFCFAYPYLFTFLCTTRLPHYSSLHVRTYSASNLGACVTKTRQIV